MRVVILGGGISGLSAAWFCHRKHPGCEIVLLEQKERLGGWIETKEEEGFCFERGPRTLSYGRSPYLVKLIEELGLREKVVASREAAKRRFVWWEGRLRSLGEFWPMMVGAAVRDLWKKRGSGEETVDAFARRRFGVGVARKIMGPLTLGIYAGDARKLSMQACFPALWQWEQQEGSVLKGWWKGRRKRAPIDLFTLEGGLEMLVRELARQVPMRVVTSCCVEALGSEIVSSRGNFIGDVVISALPAYEISRLTETSLEMPYVSIWVVHLGFSSRVLRRKGFGYLVPTDEGENLLGMVWDSEIFGDNLQTRLTAMIREESADPVRDALDALQRHLGVEEKFDYVSCHLAERAIPQFEVGYAEKIARFEAEVERKFPRLLLAGNYLAGTSVEACVARSSSIVADRGLEALVRPSGEGFRDARADARLQEV